MIVISFSSLYQIRSFIGTRKFGMLFRWVKAQVRVSIFKLNLCVCYWGRRKTNRSVFLSSLFLPNEVMMTHLQKHQKYIWWCSLRGPRASGWSDLYCSLSLYQKLTFRVSANVWKTLSLPWFFLIFLFTLTGGDTDLFDMEQFKSSFKKILQRALKNVRIEFIRISLKFNFKASVPLKLATTLFLIWKNFN